MVIIDWNIFAICIGVSGLLISILFASYALHVTITDWRWKNREWARRHLPDVR
jgi:hypothetical protein